MSSRRSSKVEFRKEYGEKIRAEACTSMVHYDLTLSYFKGKEDNDLVLFGYSRDRKRGKETRGEVRKVRSVLPRCFRTADMLSMIHHKLPVTMYQNGFSISL